MNAANHCSVYPRRVQCFWSVETQLAPWARVSRCRITMAHQDLHLISLCSSRSNSIGLSDALQYSFVLLAISMLRHNERLVASDRPNSTYLNTLSLEPHLLRLNGQQFILSGARGACFDKVKSLIPSRVIL